MYPIHSAIPIGELPNECPDCGRTLLWAEAEKPDKGVLACTGPECAKEVE